MLKFLADENFNNNIIRGLFLKNSQLDIICIQNTELLGAHDREVLEWAAQEDRILLTHDVQTITKYAYERIEAGLKMPGILSSAKFARRRRRRRQSGYARFAAPTS